MNEDDFEQRLQNQPMRQIPTDWRNEILATAREAAGLTRNDRASFTRTTFSRLRSQLVSLLWPSPQAWAGLAAVWLLLTAANRSTVVPTEDIAPSGTRSAAATIAAWKEQERILAELIQPGGIPKVEATAPAKPRPHSELTGLPRMS